MEILSPLLLYSPLVQVYTFPLSSFVIWDFSSCTGPSCAAGVITTLALTFWNSSFLTVVSLVFLLPIFTNPLSMWSLLCLVTTAFPYSTLLEAIPLLISLHSILNIVSGSFLKRAVNFQHFCCGPLGCSLASPPLSLWLFCLGCCFLLLAMFFSEIMFE